MKTKPAITIMTTILVSVLAAGLASAQSPIIIQNTRNTMNAVSDNATAASNQALGIHPTAPAKMTTTSAAPAPAKPSGAGPVTPTKSLQAVAKPAGAKRKGGPRRGGVVVATVPQPAATAPQDNSAAAATVAGNGGSGAGEGEPNEQQVVPDSKYNANGRRDPFISPVVSHSSGSGCSTGKKCLEIGTINLRGVVHAESGFIAVVSNSVNKAYFLRENDPVFNGYVVKITGDSIVFQETLQDRLGKTFTREVVKKITTPAV
ncbi:MAG TPA: hypothetical protein VIX14_09580 [Terriglobales bacterium]